MRNGERYTTKIDGENRIAVTRRSDRNSISFSFTELTEGMSRKQQWNLLNLTPEGTRRLMRKIAFAAAKECAEYCWG